MQVKGKMVKRNKNGIGMELTKLSLYMTSTSALNPTIVEFKIQARSLYFDFMLARPI